MEPKETKQQGGKATVIRIAAVAAAVAFVFIVIYTNSLVVGYVVATLLLSAFFVVVAFDIGVPKQTAAEPASDSEQGSPRPQAPDGAPRRRSARRG